MVILPKNLTALKYPGYFWDTVNHELYSCKTGVLKKIKRQRPNYFNKYKTCYQISHEGRRRLLVVEYLKKLPLKGSTFPILK